jgi:siroheme synthase
LSLTWRLYPDPSTLCLDKCTCNRQTNPTAGAGIPVTHRGLSTAFAVVTGHEDPTKDGSSTDWQALAHIPTIVVLMGLENAASICRTLVEAGRSGDIPAVAIQRGATPRQVVVRATLQSLPEAITAHNLTPPAVIVVGEVVNLADELQTVEMFG